jgi:hypothetical protein
MTTVAKMGDRFVEVVRFATKVGFSDKIGWFLLNMNLDLPCHKQYVRWVPADTRFDWVRTFKF